MEGRFHEGFEQLMRSVNVFGSIGRTVAGVGLAEGGQRVVVIDLVDFSVTLNNALKLTSEAEHLILLCY